MITVASLAWKVTPVTSGASVVSTRDSIRESAVDILKSTATGQTGLQAELELEPCKLSNTIKCAVHLFLQISPRDDKAACGTTVQLHQSLQRGHLDTIQLILNHGVTVQQMSRTMCTFRNLQNGGRDSGALRLVVI